MEGDALEHLRSLSESDIRRLLEVFRAIGYRGFEAGLQLNHRLALARMLGVTAGDRILEIGCGQGDMTAILATLVGDAGSIVAVDCACGDYGSPVSLQDAHRHIKARSIGSRIDFRLGTDLLNPGIVFPAGAFDRVVLAHSVWYLASAAMLQDLLGRARRWARRLGLAEWDLRAHSVGQLAHVQAVMLQLHVQSVHVLAGRGPDPAGNIRNAIGPREASRLAGVAGWRIVQERQLLTSAKLRYGRVSELQKAVAMASAASQDDTLDATVRHTLHSLAENLSGLMQFERASLPTYVLVGE